jgi:dTDP-4-dehydrorhamnose reductase
MKNKPKILVLGITSTVGYRYFKLNSYFDLYGFCRHWPFKKNKKIIESRDISTNNIKKVIDNIKPNIIINCIGMGNVDLCETHQKKARLINYKFTKELIALTNKLNVKLIQFSSSLIYDGKADCYTEDSIANPLSYYGRLKKEADKYIKENSSNYILIRPTTLFGIKEDFHRDNPVNFIVNKIANNENLYLIDDDLTNFLFIDDLIICINQLIISNVNGEFNIGGNESISRYELGLRIKSIMNRDSYNIRKTNSNEFKTVAIRPLNLILCNDKINGYIKLNITSLFVSLEKTINEIMKRSKSKQ